LIGGINLARFLGDDRSRDNTGKYRVPLVLRISSPEKGRTKESRTKKEKR